MTVVTKDARSRQERRDANRRANETRADQRARHESDDRARAWYAERGISLDDDNPPVVQQGPVTFFRAFFGG